MRAGLLILLTALVAGCTTPPSPHARLREEYWIDLAHGDQVTEREVLADLAAADVVYVGEIHALDRHHAIQLQLLQELFFRRVPLVLCLEQMEARDQGSIDRYARSELAFDALAAEVGWDKKWRNYPAYRGLCEFARQHRIPIRGLNAPADLIRAVSRGGGLSRLPAEQRSQLPYEIVLADAPYETLINREMEVHMAAEPARLRPMFEAQVARDETMAENILRARHLDAKVPRTAFVVLGAGHIRYGLGTPERVRRREPAIVDRLVLMSESGAAMLTAGEQSVARAIDITHEQRRAVGRAPADYLRLLPVAGLPPGHPPVGTAH
jgi:uncharacterized iron-regulated protein